MTEAADRLVVIPFDNPSLAAEAAARVHASAPEADIVFAPYGEGSEHGSTLTDFIPESVCDVPQASRWDALWASVTRRLEHSKVVALVSQQSVVCAGWLDELIAAAGAERLLAGSGGDVPGKAHPAPAWAAGPVSDTATTSCQRVRLHSSEAALGPDQYAAARLDALAGTWSHGGPLDASVVVMRCDVLASLVDVMDAADRPPATGEWGLVSLFALAEDRGWRCAVAEGVFTTTVGADTSSPAADPAPVEHRLSTYRTSGGQVLVGAVVAEVADPRDLDVLRASLRRLGTLCDRFVLVMSQTAARQAVRVIETGVQAAPHDAAMLEQAANGDPHLLDEWVRTALAVESADVIVMCLPGHAESLLDVLNAQAQAKAGAGGWVLTLFGDELVEDRVERSHLHRLMAHPNPSVRAWDFAMLTHWESQRMLRDDPPWSDGGKWTGGPHEVRLWKVDAVSPARLRVKRDSEGTLRTTAPWYPPDQVRVAGVRLRRFGVMTLEWRARAARRALKGDPGWMEGEVANLTREEGMRGKPFVARDGIGLHLLCYRNESPEDVARWLDYTHGLVDEVVVVWTDSQPPGKQLSRLLMMHDAEFIEHPLDDHIAEARNAGIRHLDARRMTDQPGLGWALFIDPDEWMHSPDADCRALRRMAEADRWGWLLQVANYRADGSTPTISDSIRMSRLDPEGIMRMDGRVHEGFGDAIRLLQSRGQHPSLVYAPFILQHRGMSYDESGMATKLDKYERLLRLELADNPANPGAWVSLGWHYMNDGHPEHGEECYRRALTCAGNSYLPYKEMAYHRLREARALIEQCSERLADAHPFSQVAHELRKVLEVHAPPHPVFHRSGDRAPEPLPEFPASSDETV